ncbi:Conserved_hypothetical protein [Hexamita inflata]|uniref:Uncharacterized protein n=1 Tax=Hexamita inflata TaxID=28002 RepID=A0ABP1H898_9EUKA
MGRPFSIDVNKFTKALASYFQNTKNMVFDTDKQLYEAFNKVYKIHRAPIWNHISQLLGKSKQQVKNFYFNSWSAQFEFVAKSAVSKSSKDQFESAMFSRIMSTNSSVVSKDSIILESLENNTILRINKQDDKDIQNILWYPLKQMHLKFSDFKVIKNECNFDWYNL